MQHKKEAAFLDSPIHKICELETHSPVTKKGFPKFRKPFLYSVF